MSDSGRVYTPNGCSPLHHDDECAHEGCEDDAEWQVDFLVDGDDIKNGHASFPYCNAHVADYFGYHPDDTEIRTDGGVDGGGSERPDQINGTPVEWRENDHGVMKCYVRVPFGQTRVLTVPRYIRNPFTDRRHDLTKLSDEGYLKPLLALVAATNKPDHIDLSTSPVLTFDDDRWEYRKQDGHHVLMKREPETKFEEKVLETPDHSDTESDRDDEPQEGEADA